MAFLTSDSSPTCLTRSPRLKPRAGSRPAAGSAGPPSDRATAAPAAPAPDPRVRRQRGILVVAGNVRLCELMRAVVHGGLPAAIFKPNIHTTHGRRPRLTPPPGLRDLQPACSRSATTPSRWRPPATCSASCARSTPRRAPAGRAWQNLHAIAAVGDDLRQAIALAEAHPPGTLGFSSAWARAERAAGRVGELADALAPAAPIVRAAVARVGGGSVTPGG